MTKQEKRPTWTKQKIHYPVKRLSYDPHFVIQRDLFKLFTILATMELIRSQNQDMCNQSNISLGGYFGYYRMVLTNQFVLNPVGHGLFQTAEYNEERLEKYGLQTEVIAIKKPAALHPTPSIVDIPRTSTRPQLTR